MVKIITKRYTPIKYTHRNKRIGIVVSDFNSLITHRLLDGCLNELQRCGVVRGAITIARVPGSFEIPLAALKLARQKAIGAVICLGAVIRGETPHYAYVAQAAADGVLHAALKTGKPVIFGVLTTDTVKQAHARSQAKGYNKGRDAAHAAIQMMDTIARL